MEVFFVGLAAGNIVQESNLIDTNSYRFQLGIYHAHSNISGLKIEGFSITTEITKLDLPQRQGRDGK